MRRNKQIIKYLVTIKPPRIMQNSNQLPPEEDYVTNLIVRIVTAFKVFTAKKAVIIIDDQIDMVFNMTDDEVVQSYIKIMGEKLDEIAVDIAINELVYGS